MTTNLPQICSPDPEFNASPAFDQDGDISPDLELETGVCYFNDVACSIGQHVLSGDEVLRREGATCGCMKGKPSPGRRRPRLRQASHAWRRSGVFA